MKINLIALGPIKEKYMINARDNFLGLIAMKIKAGGPDFKLIEIKEESTGDNPSVKEIQIALDTEAKKILDVIKPRSYTVILDVNGDKANDSTFKRILAKAEIESFDEINIIIGSSHGISEEVKNKAREKISFSSLTFPHQLFRIAFLDAIYTQIYK